MKKNSPLQTRVHSPFGGVRIPLKRRILLGIALLIGGPVITATLATSLTITGVNGNTAVEFGQGSQLVVACDTTINTAITEVWETTTSRFRVEKIVLSGLNLNTDTGTTLSNQGCGSRDMKVSVVDSQTGQMFIGNGDTGTVITIAFGTSGAVNARSTQNILGGTLAVDTSSSGLSVSNATVTYTLPNPMRNTAGTPRTSLNPADILRIALETNN